MNNDNRYNQYSSIVPSEMTNNERRHMCMELYAAMQINKSTVTVMLPHGNLYEVWVEDLADYQASYRTVTGSIRANERLTNNLNQ